MKLKQRIFSFVLCLVLTMSMGNVSKLPLIQAQDIATSGCWIDPGNYTKFWFNVSTSLDVYGNQGTKDNPYEIRTVKDLAGLSYYSNVSNVFFENKYITVTAKSLDLASHYWYPIGLTNVFCGNFDGGNCVIKNVFMGTSSSYCTYQYMGLFGRTHGNLSNLTIDNMIYYSKALQVGGLTAQWLGGSIKNCSANGQITDCGSNSDHAVGGLAGYHATSGTLMEHCHVMVNITKENNGYSSSFLGQIGSLIGGINISNTVVSDCTASGTISVPLYHNVSGLIGYINGSNTVISNCNSSTAITSSGSSKVGGLAGSVYSETSITDSAFTGFINGKNKSRIGGIAGYIDDTASIKNCYSTASVTGTRNCEIGGLIGYCENATISQCFFTGTVTTGECCNVGGFIGYSVNATVSQCFSTGTVTADKDCNAGGFIGYHGNLKVYNSYTTSNISAGSSCSVGGFIGSACQDYVKCNSIIENCYASCSIRAGKSSIVGNFYGDTNTDYVTNTFKRCYWNKSCQQIVADEIIPDASKTGVSYNSFPTVQAASATYMQSDDFVADMNEYVNQATANYSSWTRSDSINDGMPYLTLFQAVLKLNTSADKEFDPNETSTDQQDFNVYGIMEFPEFSELPDSPEPTTSSTPKPDKISVNLEWGSLEYIYKSGAYNTETKKYADGVWKPTEAGKSDIIRLTNRSTMDIQALFCFLPNTKDSTNYQNLFGTFQDASLQTPFTDPLTLSAKQGNAVISNDIQLCIGGVPEEKINKANKEVIGQVILTISPEKGKEPVPSQIPENTASGEETSPADMSSETPTPTTTEPSESPVPYISDTPTTEPSGSPVPYVSDTPTLEPTGYPEP
ncbi:GLUG motif-containing protein [[Clostridium] polysaccharolyticum]|uniref:The GLUG motif-containing protein n=1 Tax=[Clostridium] polysaccharolyticum TaxID=29364 RepID=A0A1H9ZVP2_9FIRM|nr:GLUG motif-containing protein [[Clostridium] polysaccharolyticum]SES85448.1 The GLUG motif-containing protein [[Clostridium] polysaccharolyticum]